jgi:hypothetical protein
LLKKIRPFITDLATVRIYQALIVPLVTYCSLTNFYHQPSRKASLSILEYRVRKLAKKHNVPSINEIYEKKICLTVFKCSNGHFPYFNNYFERISHDKGTRNNNKILRVPKIKLQSTKKAFFYNGVLLFNQLPVDTRAETDFWLFHKKLNSIFKPSQ